MEERKKAEGCGLEARGTGKCGLEARGTGKCGLEARDTRGKVHAGWRNRGYVPHFDSHGIVQHIIFRLADALPSRIIADLKHFPETLKLAKIDEALDKGCGLRLLADPPVAEIVEQVLLHFDGERYRLFAWCVMPTHVHVLAEQMEGYPLSQVIHSWKSFSANVANDKLRRSGAFWAPEYYDRFMRDGDQFETTRAYIENNPVAASLCSTAKEGGSLRRGRDGSERMRAGSPRYKKARAGSPRYKKTLGPALFLFCRFWGVERFE